VNSVPGVILFYIDRKQAVVSMWILSQWIYLFGGRNWKNY